MKIRVPIWIKLFLMTMFILLLAMIPTAYTNHARISSESIDREWQIVSQQAESRAQETRLVLAHLIEKSQFIATQLLGLQMKQQTPTVKELASFTNDPHMLNLEIISLEDGKSQVLLRQTQAKALAEYKLHPSYFYYLHEKSKFPVQKVFSGQMVVENASGFIGSADPQFGVFTIGVPFSKDASGKIEAILLADIHIAALQKPFLQKSESLAY